MRPIISPVSSSVRVLRQQLRSQAMHITTASKMPRKHEHQYPGVDLPLRHFPQKYRSEGTTFFRMGAHAACVESESAMLQLREVAMLILMDRLSDKPGWHEKVFDDEIVAKWRREALAQSEEALYATIIADKDRAHNELQMPLRYKIVSGKCFDCVCFSMYCCICFWFKAYLH